MAVFIFQVIIAVCFRNYGLSCESDGRAIVQRKVRPIPSDRWFC